MSINGDEVEILATLLRARNGVEKATLLLQQFGSLRSVMNASPNQLGHFVTEKQAEYIVTASKAMLAANTSLTDRARLTTPGESADLFIPRIAHLQHEEFWVATLSTKNYVLDIECLYKGTLNSSFVRVAEVFRMAIILNAAAIIVAHNHPSGDPIPSPDDVKVTQNLIQAGKLLEIDVLDHIVVGGGPTSRFTSMRSQGYCPF